MVRVYLQKENEEEERKEDKEEEEERKKFLFLTILFEISDSLWLEWSLKIVFKQICWDLSVTAFHYELWSFSGEGQS